MIREILTYPDKRLWQVSNDVENFDESLHHLLDDMYETMISKDGIGLAAIQIGVTLNALVINLMDEDTQKQHKEDLMEVINPKITHKEGSIVFTEGCLSVPEIFENVERFNKIKISYQDRFGNEKEEEHEGLMAIALQHEMDHLLGHLFIEKFSYLKRKKFEKEYKKLQKARQI